VSYIDSDTANATRASPYLSDGKIESSVHGQWRGWLWGTGARAPRLPTISLLVYFGINLRANYPSIV